LIFSSLNRDRQIFDFEGPCSEELTDKSPKRCLTLPDSFSNYRDKKLKLKHSVTLKSRNNKYKEEFKSNSLKRNHSHIGSLKRNNSNIGCLKRNHRHISSFIRHKKVFFYPSCNNNIGY
jgi:hypothetical protein